MTTSPRMKRSGFIRGVSASVVDQALLSLVNLAVGMAFIRYSSKEDYAAYAQVWALIFFSTSIQGAIVLSPSVTMVPRAVDGGRRRLAGSFFVLHVVFGVAFALAFTLVYLLYPALLSTGLSTLLFAWAFAFSVWVAWLRDFVRNLLFIELRTDACLKLDAGYACVCLIGFSALIATHNVSLGPVLLTMAAAGMVTAVPALLNADIAFHGDRKQVGETLREAWSLARWALPGGLISWAIGSGYVLISAKVVGPVSTAEIVAARLFVAPLGVAYLAWGNVFRPRASHWLAEGRVDRLKQVSYAAMVVIAAAVAVYVTLLLAAYPYLEAAVLLGKYAGLSRDVGWWGAFFMASGIAGIGTGVLLAMGRFRDTFFAAIAGFLVSIPLVFLLGHAYGKDGILLGLTIGEVVTATWLFVAMQAGLRVFASSKVGA